jgi:hypothetical protein
MRRILLAPALLAHLLLGATLVGAEEPQAYVATIETAKGRYRAIIRDPEMVEKARRELRGEADAGVPIGPLAWGDGGVNRGHVWHVTELGFADFTIELCDGTVRAVDRDPSYWVETVGSFCPWSGQVVKLKPVADRPARSQPG